MKSQGIPDDIMDTLYSWRTAGHAQLQRAKAYLFGRSDVMFNVRYRGDIEEGTAHITCTVLEEAGDKGNLYNLGEIVIDRYGHHFDAWPPAYQNT